MDVLNDFVSKQKEFADALTKDIKLLCFSQDNFNEDFRYNHLYGTGYAKPRMWAQYSNNHKGACLVLNKWKLINEISNRFKNLIFKYGNINYGFDYTDEFKKAFLLKASDLLSKNIQDIVDEMLIKYQDIYYFTKHPDWKEENEFRIMVKYPENEFAYINIDGLLEGILLGTEFDENLLKLIDLLTQNYTSKPLLYRLYYDNNSFHVQSVYE